MSIKDFQFLIVVILVLIYAIHNFRLKSMFEGMVDEVVLFNGGGALWPKTSWK